MKPELQAKKWNIGKYDFVVEPSSQCSESGGYESPEHSPSLQSNVKLHRRSLTSC